jgi:hypothetical protein
VLFSNKKKKKKKKNKTKQKVVNVTQE